MASQNRVGISLAEVLVALVVLFVLWVVGGYVLFPRQDGNAPSGKMVQTLSNMQQLYFATRQMEIDRNVSGKTNIGWIGDTGGSFSNWTTQLVRERYMTTNDLCKLLSVPGMVVPPGKIPTTNDTGILVYAVSANSPDAAIFLSTANFINTPDGGILNTKAKPFGAKGFVVFTKGGEGDILQPRKREPYGDPESVTVFRSYADHVAKRYREGSNNSADKPYEEKGPFVFTHQAVRSVLHGSSTNSVGVFLPLCR